MHHWEDDFEKYWGEEGADGSPRDVAESAFFAGRRSIVPENSERAVRIATVASELLEVLEALAEFSAPMTPQQDALWPKLTQVIAKARETHEN